MDGMVESSAQVLIVGGGPVGLGLAIDLGQRGVQVALIERHAQPQPIPKGQNLTQRTMEHFHFWKAEAELRAARTIPKEYGIGGMTAYGTLLSGYRYDWLQRETVRPYYFTDNERLPQYATEAVLRNRASEIPFIETWYGWNADTFDETGAGIGVTIKERTGTGSRRIHAEYVVGCDGSRSTVRDAAGMTQSRSDHDRLMVLLVFRSTRLHELLERFPNKSFYNVLNPELQGYWQFFGRVDLGTTWFFHAPVPLGTTRDNFDFKQLLFAAVGAEIDVAFEHIGFWDLRFAIADQYRHGRLFIAGDAAHSHPPYGGYGINTGLEDAVNLGWKLAAVLNGWAGPGLLDSYHVERQPVFASTARDFIEKAISNDKAFLAEYDPVENLSAFESEWDARSRGTRSEVGSFEPNYEGSPVVFGPANGVCSAVGSHESIARAGHHLTPLELTGGPNTFDELGDYFTLIELGGSAEIKNEFERAAKDRGIPLRVVSHSDPDGRKFYDADLILVRPDQFVAWTSRDGVLDPSLIFDRATGFSNDTPL